MPEMSLWDVHLAQRQKLEDLKWDRRFFGLWVAIGRFFCGAFEDVEPATFFPALFEGAEASQLKITDPIEMRDVMKALCLAFGGKVVEPEPEQQRKDQPS